MRLRGVVSIAILLPAAALIAANHHSLNGTWNLVPAQSEFAGEPVIQRGSVTINDREHNITISRNFTFEGADQTLSYNFTVDGRENSSIRDGKISKTKAKWDGDELKVTTTEANVISVERFNLMRDGTMRMVVERPNHPVITLYLRRE